MRIEEGKFYRAANGGKVGPMKPMGGVFIQEVGDGYSWNPDGTCYAHGARYRSDHHLVAEWTEGPVRTVTRQEIIPGTYDGVEVGSEVTGHPQRELMVRIAPDHGPMVCMDHAALTNAAAVLTALAGALRDAS